jgi:hypothetical protein
MTSQPHLETKGRRRVVRAAGVIVAVAAFALCAYAGGRSRGTQAAPARGGVTLTAIKAKARAGRAAKSGPSANVNQPIRLQGTGFDGNVSVQFTAFANSTFLVRPTEVKNRRVTVPVPGQVVTGAVLLSDPEAGQSNTLGLQIVPTITSLSATSIAPGGRLLIDGTGFTPMAKVTFKGVSQPVTPTIVSPTRIDILVPASAQTGKITVVTDGGTSKAMKLTVTAQAR